MVVDVIWEDDETQPDYNEIGLHGMHNTNFQEFIFQNGALKWEDSGNIISTKF